MIDGIWSDNVFFYVFFSILYFPLFDLVKQNCNTMLNYF